MAKIYFVPDIHGEYDSLIYNLKSGGLINDSLELTMGKKDKIIFLGDFIDRGSKSKQVIDFLMKIEASNPNQVIPLMGNHEKTLLTCVESNFKYTFRNWLDDGGNKTMKSYGADIISFHLAKSKEEKFYNLMGHETINFLKTLKLYHIEDIGGLKILFCHAGLNPNGSINTIDTILDPITSDLSVLWIRDHFFNHPDPSFIKEKYGVDLVVFGHTPSSSGRFKLLNKLIFPIMGNNSPIFTMDYKAIACDSGSGYKNGVTSLFSIDENKKLDLVSFVRNP